MIQFDPFLPLKLVIFDRLALELQSMMQWQVAGASLYPILLIVETPFFAWLTIEVDWLQDLSFAIEPQGSRFHWFGVF